MTMAGREARMLDAIYRTYGRPALWAPVGGGEVKTPVVRHDVRDGVDGFGQGQAVIRSNLVFVRRADFVAPAEPSEGDVVEIAREAGGFDTYRIIAQPRLEPDGLEWMCEAAELAA